MRLFKPWVMAFIVFSLVVVGSYYLNNGRYLDRFAENQILLDIAPPPVGSEKALYDKDIFLLTRSYQDNPRWQKAIQDSDLKPSHILAGFDCAAQRHLVDVENSNFQLLYHKTIGEVKRLTRKSKDTFQQKRPYEIYHGPICTPIAGDDYPSGHAMIGWMTARLLAEIYPGQKEQLFNHARSFAESRVICGVHSVSAVEIAEYYSNKIMERLKKTPSFQRDLEMAKKQMQSLSEWKLEWKNEDSSCEQFPAQFVKPFSNTI